MFLLQCSLASYEYTMTCLSILLLIWIVSSFQLLLATFLHKKTHTRFPPRSRNAGAQCRHVLSCNRYFQTVSKVIYSLYSRYTAWEVQLRLILTNICYWFSVILVDSGIALWFSWCTVILSTFSNAYCLFGYPLLWRSCSNLPPPLFLIGLFVFFLLIYRKS